MNPTDSCPSLPSVASRAFEITLAGAEPKVLSEQGVIVGSQISFKEAHDRLEDFDVLVISGGNSAKILETEEEPAGLIVDFSELQKKDPGRERTILSVCTGSLFLAKEGILSGLYATTHPDYLTKFEILCSEAATRNLQERTDVVEDARYVVNNLRFDLGDEDENPDIRRKSDSGRRPSNARYVTCQLGPGYPILQQWLMDNAQKGKHVVEGLQQPPRVHCPPRRDASWGASGHHGGGQQRWRGCSLVSRQRLCG